MPVDDKQTNVGAQNDDAENGAGARLSAARLEQSLTLEQVAEKLHLDESVIVALEAEAFDALGAPVFVRGHLKAYAILLGLSSDEILSLCQEPREEAQIMPLRSAITPAPAVSPVIWGCSALAIIVMVALGMYIMGGDSEVAVADQTTASVATLREAEPIDSYRSEADPSASGPSEPESVLPRAVLIQPPVLVEAELAGESGLSGDKVRQPDAEMRLRLSFSQDSWVEISDASSRLLFGLQRTGDRELTGEAPFNVLIGNVRGVSLTVNGRDFDIPLTAIRGKVARFEITAEDFEQD